MKPCGTFLVLIKDALSLAYCLMFSDCDCEEAAENLVDDALYNQLREMLQDDRYNQTNVAQLVAELAKAGRINYRIYKERILYKNMPTQMFSTS